ncbi:MAG: hypothetical protein HETSPECPRED_007996 [Heterodermia speciosa]|uniref:C2H2-type domain-containing protein n=1 Tax=Heterodermia speciosa TaxID=116794 RepID=A0A8H3I5J1_9LECA|nr:MAG: hypothetical protein HETSPECPRED_007996 [Heterodermia speciosa]
MGELPMHIDQLPKALDHGTSYFPSQCDDNGYEWDDLGSRTVHDLRFNGCDSDGTVPPAEIQNLTSMQRYLQCHEQRALFNPGPAYHRASVESKPYAFHGIDLQAPWSHKPVAPSVPSPYGSQVDHRSFIDQDSLSSGSVWSPRTSETYPDHETASDRRLSTPCDALGYGSDQHVHSVGSNNSSGGNSNSYQVITPTDVLRYPEEPTNAEADREDFFSEPTLQNGAVNAPYYNDAPTLAHCAVKPARSIPEDEGIGSSINDDSTDSACAEDEDIAMEDNDDKDADYKPSKRAKSSSNRGTSKACNGSRSPIMPRRSSGVRPASNRVTKGSPRSSTASPKRWNRASTNNSLAPNPITAPESQLSPIIKINHNQNRCTRCPQSYASISTLNKHIQSTHTRPFTCTFTRYGCPSTFGSKNEWKRHVTSQHLRPGVWRCDIDRCVPKASPSARRRPSTAELDSAAAATAETGGSWNEFNRKDLFTQHVRRMHGPPVSAARAEKDAFETSLEGVRARCWRQLHPAPPRSVCGFCSHVQQHGRQEEDSPSAQLANIPSDNDGEETKPLVFEGKLAWEERMEHVGRHLEKQSCEEEEEDVGLREWMVKEGLMFWERGAWRVVGIAEGKKRGGRAVKAESGPGDGEEDAEGEDE